MTVQKSQYNTLLNTIGNTPLVRLQRLSPNPNVNILVKVEFFNPGSSIKDRIVKYIIDDAEKRGALQPGGTIIEGTSGNTGAAVAMIAAIRGYQAILTMTDKVSIEKQDALKAFGAEIVITSINEAPDSPEHYVNKAKQLAKETPNSFFIDQYNNPLNPEAHYHTTGPEIWSQTDGHVDYLIASGSTGGTVSGIGKFLKEKNPNVKVIMPDPVGSVFKEYFKTGNIPKGGHCNYYLEGVGEDHIAHAIDFSVIDDVISVTDKNAFNVARELAQKEGILAGGSSGANVWAAIELAKTIKGKANIVAILPDSGIKYLSKLYNNKWMKEHIL